MTLFYLQFFHKQKILFLPLEIGCLPRTCSPRSPTSHQHPIQDRGLNVEGQVIRYQLAAFDLHVRGANLACYLKKNTTKKTQLHSGEQRHFAELLLSINERRCLEAVAIQQRGGKKKTQSESDQLQKTAIAKSIM